jgi:hypothetical protein
MGSDYFDNGSKHQNAGSVKPPEKPSAIESQRRLHIEAVKQQILDNILRSDRPFRK